MPDITLASVTTRYLWIPVLAMLLAASSLWAWQAHAQANTPRHGAPDYGAVVAGRAGCSPAPWVAAAALPTPTRWYAFAQDGGNFYVIAGQSVSLTNNVYRYNAAGDAWTLLAPIPFPGGGRYPAAAYHAGKIYVIEGLTDDPGDALSIYDIATDTWASGAHMPQLTYGSAAGAYGGKFYVAGGLLRSVLRVYDMAANTWTFGSALPSPYFVGGFTQVGQYLYLVGDQGGGTTTQRLDMATGDWSVGPAWTPARYDLALASDGAKLYAIGGSAGGTASAQVDELDLASWPDGSWVASLENLPSPRSGNRAGFAANGRIWTTGGSGPGGTPLAEHLYRDVSTCVTGTPTTVTPTPTGTLTPVLPSATGTPAASHTPTPIPTSTDTPQATNTPVPSTTATPCAIAFSDVQPTDYFHEPVRFLYCLGAISGYADNTFRPYNTTTRGQLCKIVVLAEGFPIDTTGGPHFSDVPPDNPFYGPIETAFNRGIVSGYADGTFRWGNEVTRGQLCKIVVDAEGWPLSTPGTPTFSDVPAAHPFYGYIETAYERGIISGYADGTFRPGNSATRGQIARIVYGAITSP